MTTFPFTKLISAHDTELTPLIQKAIGQYIREAGRVKYPHVAPDVLEQLYRESYDTQYHALALLITKELKEYAKTITPNPNRGPTPSR